MAKLNVGDRVKYSVNFLCSVGAHTGPLGFARGVIVAIKPCGRELSVARIEWDKDKEEIPESVNVKNLMLANKPG